jgi:hypothetical protein
MSAEEMKRPSHGAVELTSAAANPPNHETISEATAKRKTDFCVAPEKMKLKQPLMTDPTAKLKRARSRMHKTLYSDVHTRKILKYEWARLHYQFKQCWSTMDVGNMKVQTWQTLYEQEDGVWQSKQEKNNISTYSFTDMDINSKSDKFMQSQVNNSSSHNLLLAKPSFSRLNVSTFGQDTEDSRDSINSLRQDTVDSRCDSTSIEQKYKITQHLLDRLLLLSVWYPQRDIHKDLVEQILSSGGDPNWVTPDTGEIRNSHGDGEHHSIFYGRCSLHLAAYKGNS